MEKIPSELKYTSTHEWVRLEDDGTVVIGITDHAQNLLGDMVYVEAPETEQEVKAGDEVCVVESVKAASDVYAPITGEILEANDALVDAPNLVNEDPYGNGWLFRMQPNDTEELYDLLDDSGYAELVENES